MPDIFDKIAGGLNKGVAVVGANSKAMVEKARVNTAIKNLEDEKRRLMEFLGMKVYEIHMSGKAVTDGDIASFAEEIKNAQILSLYSTSSWKKSKPS